MVTEQGQPRPQRIGDAERDSATELLREHLAQGRLSAEEFDERIDAALRAKVASDLDPLFDDLPGPRPGQAVATTTPYEAPTWQSQTSPAANPLPTPAVLPPRTGGADRLRGLIGVMWIAFPLLITVLPGSWGRFWWLIFVPVIVSMVLGKKESDRERERRHIARDQERLDRRRRALDD